MAADHYADNYFFIIIFNQHTILLSFIFRLLQCSDLSVQTHLLQTPLRSEPGNSINWSWLETKYEPLSICSWWRVISAVKMGSSVPITEATAANETQSGLRASRAKKSEQMRRFKYNSRQRLTDVNQKSLPEEGFVLLIVTSSILPIPRQKKWLPAELDTMRWFHI